MQLVHVHRLKTVMPIPGSALLQATILCALLQPQPESYDLFDDVLLMAEGSIIYHGPRTEIVAFFQSCGFTCPERKGVPDFLQEVTSKKDQVQRAASFGNRDHLAQ